MVRWLFPTPLNRKALMRRAICFGCACLAGFASCTGGAPDAPTSVTPVPFVPIVSSVAIAPAAVSLTVGASVPLTATVKDQRDSVMSGKVVQWSSSSASIASVASTGTVTALAAGVASITASVDGKQGSVIITVTAATLPPATTGFQTNVPPIDLNVIAARPTSSSVSLSVLSGTTRSATVTLLSEGRSVTQPLAAQAPNVFELTGLAADRVVRYRVDAGASSVSGSVRTGRASGATWRFDVQADSHLDSNSDPAVYANTLTNMLADSADFLVDLGDTFMSEKYADYRDGAAQYYAQRYYFGKVGATMPLYLVQGNHDGELGWTAANAAWAAEQRTKYFPPVQGNTFYSTNAAPRNYYAWRWGDAMFIALDPYVATGTQPGKAGTPWAFTLGKEQYDWLVATLQQNSAPYTFVFIHNLVGGNGTEGRGGSEASVFYEWGGKNADGTSGFAAQRPGWLKPIHDVLAQYQVSAIFHGHDHLYVHQTRDGIHYQEVPQPSLAREGQISSAAAYGYVTGTLQSSSGHMRITIAPKQATVEYVRSRLGAGNGGIVDSYTITPATRP